MSPSGTVGSVGSVQDLAELRREGLGIAGLPVLAAQEPAVMAREEHRAGAKTLGHREGAAVRQLAFRLDAGREDDAGRGCTERRVVGLVVGEVDHVLTEHRVVTRAVVLGGHPEHRRVGGRLDPRSHPGTRRDGSRPR